jgi:beta-galactosidase
MEEPAHVMTCEGGRFLLDGEPFFIYSGEIHYFRLNPKCWPLHLQAARAAGLNTVSTYIPWLWHEPEEGRFDFTGETHAQRNLVRYLELVEKHGLRFIARVGPVSNAELANEGVPQWLIRDHPDVFVRGREITNLPHTTLLAYHSPAFQERVGRWYDAVLPIVSRHAHPRGPVVLVQLCNEIGMVQWLQKAADYGPATERMYRGFLRQRYEGDLERLNRAHGTRYRDFDEVAQPPSGDDRQGLRLLHDWMAFYQHYYATYFGGLHARYAAHGIELPVMANLPQFYDFDVRGRGVFAPMTAMMFRDFPEQAPGVVFGGAYQIRRVDYENFHDLAITSEVLKMIGGPEVPAMCAELQSGIMRDRPRLYPQDVELTLKTSAAHGLNALNAYMFSGGRNEPGMGAFGAYHEWQAAVAADGRRRSHFAALRDFGRQLRCFGPLLADTRKHADVVVGFYAPYWTTEYLTGPAIEAWEWKKQHLFYDGLGRLLQLAHLNYSLIDLERATLEELTRLPALVVFTLEFMDAETQAKLVAYVKVGGRLLLNPELPVRDGGLEPCTILADSLGVRVVGQREGSPTYRVDGVEALAPGGLSWYEAPGAEVLARTVDGQPCGLSIEKDRGRVLLLGFGLNHMFDYQVALVGGFAARLGIRPAIETDPDLQVCLRANGGYGFLFVANYHDEPRAGRIRMVLPGESRATCFPSRGKLTLAARRSYVLPLNLPLTGGDVLRYAAVEVLEARARGREKKIVVTGAPGARGEVELVTASRAASLDGRRLAVQRVGRRLRVGFATTGGPQMLVVR